jgi:hypothetical protein
MYINKKNKFELIKIFLFNNVIYCMIPDYNFFKKIKLYKYYDEPNTRYNIVSTVIFRLENNYKPMENYYLKIMKLVDNFYDFFGKDFYLRIYFDNSIVLKSGNEFIDNEIDNVWIKLLKKLKSFKFVQLCRYKHKDFLKNNIFHRGLFGTVIRFLPLFNVQSNNNIKDIIVSDIDVNFILLNYMKKGYQFVVKHDLKLFFKTSYCKYIAGYHNVTINMLNTWLRLLAGTVIVHNYKFNPKILNDFFSKIVHKNYDEYMIKFINIGQSITYKNKTPSEEIFKYGYDEFFLVYLLDNAIKQKIKIGYVSTKDFDAPIYYYYRKNNNFDSNDEQKLKLFEDILMRILGKYYNKNISLQNNYLQYEKEMFVIYDNNKLNQKQLTIANNTFDFYDYVKKNNLYDHYGFTIYEIKCGLFQKNKIFPTNNSNELFIFNENIDTV